MTKSSASEVAAKFAVELNGVTKFFSSSGEVLRSVDLAISEGDFVSLLGPSGSGKSTLLRLIAGLENPDSGTLRAISQKRSFVFQEAHLLPWRNVLENVSLPLELLRHGNVQERREQSQEVLRKVGLQDSLRKYPHELSGGMKMRVAVARALISNPRLLLLDEPFAALDENTRFSLQEELRSLWSKEKSMTVIFVTHSVTEAVFLSERAVILSQRPAQVVGDVRIQLPEERGFQLRTQPSFNAEVKRLYDSYPVTKSHL